MKKLHLFILLLLGHYLVAQNGSLDPAFGGDGIENITIQTEINGVDLIVQDNGKINTLTNRSQDENVKYILAVNYLNSNGSEAGTQISYVHQSSVDFIMSAEKKPDGNLLLTGQKYNRFENTTNAMLRELESSGGVSTAFNGENTVVIKAGELLYNDGNLPSAFEKSKIHNNQIISVGYLKNPNNSFDALICRQNMDGSVDTDFGNNGFVVLNTFEQADDQLWESFKDLTILENNSIVVTGFTTDDEYLNTISGGVYFMLAKYDWDGNLMNDWGDDGLVKTKFGDALTFLSRPETIAQLENGKFLVGGDSYIVCYNSDGTLDESFGENGIYEFSTRKIIRMKVKGNKIITLIRDETGFAGTTHHIYQLNLEGTLDETFGGNGVVHLTFNDENTTYNVTDLKTTPTGNILIVGYDKVNKNNIELQQFISDLNVGIIDAQKETITSYVYPNPIQSEFNLEYELLDASTVTIELVDITGKKITTLLNEKRNVGKQAEAFTMPNTLSKGIYFCHIYTDRGKAVVKITKQ